VDAESANSPKYWAFISYSHVDRKWGDWLHRALETYRPPRGLIGKPGRDGVVRRKNPPIFRDREELPSSANLSDNINEALRESRYLIVICSPHAAISRWVNEEIIHFKSLGREDRVLCLIVEGEPNATDKPESGKLECFPPAIRFHVSPEGELTDQHTEPIAADAREEGDGKRNAKLKLAAGLLGVKYNDLKQREKWRALRRNASLALLALTFLGTTAWWLFQKGEVNLAVTPSPFPAGLRVSIDGRATVFDPNHPVLRLSAGKHALRFEAENFQTVEQNIEIERRARIDKVVDLVHEKGMLNVEVYPAEATVEVDGKPLGSRVEGLELDTGPHVVRATRTGHYQQAEDLTVRKTETSRAYLFLPRVETAWSIQRWDVQGGFINMGDVDGDGVEDFAHNFITEVAIISGATGKLLREFPTRDGNARPFRGVDLGGALGRVLLSAGVRNAVDAQGNGQTDLLCLSSAQEGPAWKWLGRAPRSGYPLATIVGDQNGDGVSEIVVSSDDNNFFVVDGAKGVTLNEFEFGVTEWAPTPRTMRCTVRGEEGLLFCGQTLQKIRKDLAEDKTYHAGFVSLKDGRIVWQKDFAETLGFYVEDFHHDGRSQIAFVSRTDWVIVDGATGETRFHGRLPRPDPQRALVQFFFADLDGDGTAEWIMMFHDSVLEPKPLIAAIRLRDNKILWQREDLVPVQQQLLEDNQLVRAVDGGLILRIEDALVCVDPVSGRTRWRREVAPGEVSESIARVNGKPEIFLNEPGKRVRSLGLSGQPSWSLDREYSGTLVLIDRNHPSRTRVILTKHSGSETKVNEIACVLPPESQDWARRVVPEMPPDGTPGASEPRSSQINGRNLVWELAAAPSGQPEFACFDGANGVRLWKAQELFQTAYRRHRDPVDSGETEAAPAVGNWGSGNEPAVALVGHELPTLLESRTSVFVYRAEDGRKLAAIPLEPRGDAYAASLLADVDSDGQTDFLVARPNLIENTGRNVSGDVVMVGGAQQKQTWRRELPLPDALTVTKVAGEKFARVIVTQRDGTVCALRGTDGEILWQNKELHAATPAEANGQSLIYVASEDGTVSAVDPGTGKIRASTKISGVAETRALRVANGFVLVSCGATGIVALDLETLRERWRSPAGESVSTATAVGDVGGGSPAVVACTDSGDLLVLDFETGALISREPLAEGQPAVPHGSLSLLPAKNGQPAKVFVTCSPKEAPVPPAAMLLTKTIRLSK
jgi:outer membrane protein assembly factor BamB